VSGALAGRPLYFTRSAQSVRGVIDFDLSHHPRRRPQHQRRQSKQTQYRCIHRGWRSR